MFDYDKSVKSSVSDELINTYLLRPLAGLVVRAVYSTRVTPNQLTLASTAAGLIAALMYLQAGPIMIAYAGLFITIKDVLDSADGQLARTKQLYSRTGRFLDSIGDFVVNLFVFAAIGWVVSVKHGSPVNGILAFLGLLGTTFRVSYHVFYQSSYLHLERKYFTNRITEEVRDEDKTGDRSTLFLQNVFQVIYGWQDRVVLRIDSWCTGRGRREEFRGEWFSDVPGMRLSGLLGMGTELFILTAFSILNRLEAYLYANLILLNGLLLANILYRRVALRQKLLLRLEVSPP